jgi:DNA-binding SARP family transcriptional activator/predicted ATPase
VSEKSNPVSLRVDLLGRCGAVVDGREVQFAYDKVRALLAYLVLEADGPVARGRLAGLLWPDQSEGVAASSLRQALSRLRQSLGDRESRNPLLLVCRETVQLSPESGVQVDVREFLQLLEQVPRHRHRHPRACAYCDQLRSRACSLYKGDFLGDLAVPDSSLFDDWALVWRERLLRLAVEAFQERVSLSTHRGDDARTAELVSRLLTIDPWNEHAHAELLRVMVKGGRRADAVQHYRELRDRLAEEMGIQPSEELEEIAEGLAHGGQTPDPEDRETSVRGMPLSLEPFVGRIAELDAVVKWLEEPGGRLATVTGPGGIGKTRLGMEAAHSEAWSFEGGAVYLSLEGGEAGWDSRAAQLTRGKDILLVLDAFEHVMTSRSVLERLLRENPRLVVLATSRVHLGISGETVFPLAGLEAPPPEASEEAERYEAVALFVQSARCSVPGFALGAPDREAVAEICRLVDGLPLALNLAAAWVSTLSCHEIAAEIRRGLDILVTGERDGAGVPGLASVFRQSLQLLGGDERRVFPRLSVFRGGFDRDAAAAVAGADLATLNGLVRKSFMHRSSGGRYNLHGLFRQYGQDLLRADGESESVARRHLDYYLAGAESRDSDFRSAASFKAFHWLVLEQPNMAAALAWARMNDSSAAERLAVAMHSEIHGFGVHLLGRPGGGPAQPET